MPVWYLCGRISPKKAVTVLLASVGQIYSDGFKNIRLTNPRNKYIEVYEDKWKYKNKKETLDDILILINEVIENNYESNKETMEKSIKKTLINYFNQFDNNKMLRDKATENVELSILNNSKEEKY